MQIDAIMNSQTLGELETFRLFKSDKDCFHAFNVREKELLKIFNKWTENNSLEI